VGTRDELARARAHLQRLVDEHGDATGN